MQSNNSFKQKFCLLLSDPRLGRLWVHISFKFYEQTSQIFRKRISLQ